MAITQTTALKVEAINALLAVRQRVDELLPDIERLRRSVEWKIDGSPVSAADRLVEAEVEKLLVTRFGQLNFIGEETFQENQVGSADLTAVLDPIDGTENFISGLKEWGSSLSLWWRKKHLASILLLPELNQSLVTGNEIEKHESRIHSFSSSTSSELISRLQIGQENRISGCAVFNLFSVVTGRFSTFSNPVGAYSWDLLAGLQLALEHGCKVEVEGEKYDGEYLEPGQRYRVEISSQ